MTENSNHVTIKMLRELFFPNQYCLSSENKYTSLSYAILCTFIEKERIELVIYMFSWSSAVAVNLFADLECSSALSFS